MYALEQLRAAGVRCVIESDPATPIRVTLTSGPLSVFAEGLDLASAIVAAERLWNEKRLELVKSVPHILV